MPNPTPNRPLWEVMFNARCSTMDDENIVSEARACAAAELRAIAKEASKRLSPEESSYPHDGRDLVAWLRAEADRAEAGE